MAVFRGPRFAAILLTLGGMRVLCGYFRLGGVQDPLGAGHRGWPGLTTVAIDLGATSVRVAYRDGQPGELRALRGPDGTDAIPAIVWFAGPGDVRVGAPPPEARPEEVIESVRADLAAVSPSNGLVNQRAGSPHGRYFHGRFESPENVAWHVLRDSVRRATAEAGGPIRGIILAKRVTRGYGGSLRRYAAADGLTIDDRTDEPVATALHYGALGDGVDHVAVVHDLGGTTLDVTVVRIQGRNVTIVRSASLPIGGRAWDAALARALLADRHDGGRWATEAPLTPAVLRAAESIRIQLSEHDQATGTLPAPGGALMVKVDRERLMDATRHLLHQMVEFTRATVNDAAGDVDPAQTILLAGGASQMPAVPKALEDRLALRVRTHLPHLAVLNGLTLARDFGLLFTIGGQDGPAALLRPHITPSRQRRPVPWLSADDERNADDPGGLGQEPASAESLPAGPLPLADALIAHLQSARSGPETILADPDPPPVREPANGTAMTSGAVTSDLVARDLVGSDMVTSDLVVRDIVASDMVTGDLMPPLPNAVGLPSTRRPVGSLDWLRRGERVLLTWAWPADSTHAVVRWQLTVEGTEQGSARCTLNDYKTGGGFELRVGRAGARVTVEAYSRASVPDGEPPSVVEIPAAEPTVSYLPVVVKRGWREWTVEMRFTSDAECSLPELLVVRGTGRYQPMSQLDGTVIRRVPPQTFSPGTMASVSFTIHKPQGICWLACLPDDPNDPAARPLRPASLHRLRVSLWHCP
jgi:hypothetical protein